MNIEQLNAQFSSEAICRQFFEAVRWPDGRVCPHCSFTISYKVKVNGRTHDRYECKRCKGQFTVTTKTAMHSTKLPLLKWLQAMYLIVSSSKGISSVVCTFPELMDTPNSNEYNFNTKIGEVCHAEII